MVSCLFNYLAYSFHKSSLFLLNCEKVWTITYNLKYWEILIAASDEIHWNIATAKLKKK